MIEYVVEKDLSVDEFRQILISSTLGERRPVDDLPRLKKMIEQANLVITARRNGVLVGVARSITDFTYCTYLSDLAVDKNHQKKGIGKALILRTKVAAPEAKLILLSAPGATDYYPKIGLSRHENCFVLNDVRELH